MFWNSFYKSTFKDRIFGFIRSLLLWTVFAIIFVKQSLCLLCACVFFLPFSPQWSGPCCETKAYGDLVSARFKIAQPSQHTAEGLPPHSCSKTRCPSFNGFILVTGVMWVIFRIRLKDGVFMWQWENGEVWLGAFSLSCTSEVFLLLIRNYSINSLFLCLVSLFSLYQATDIHFIYAFCTNCLVWSLWPDPTVSYFFRFPRGTLFPNCKCGGIDVKDPECSLSWIGFDSRAWNQLNTLGLRIRPKPGLKMGRHPEWNLCQIKCESQIVLLWHPLTGPAKRTTKKCNMYFSNAKMEA